MSLRTFLICGKSSSLSTASLCETHSRNFDYPCPHKTTPDTSFKNPMNRGLFWVFDLDLARCEMWIETEKKYWEAPCFFSWKRKWCSLCFHRNWIHQAFWKLQKRESQVKKKVEALGSPPASQQCFTGEPQPAYDISLDDLAPNQNTCKHLQCWNPTLLFIGLVWVWSGVFCAAVGSVRRTRTSICFSYVTPASCTTTWAAWTLLWPACPRKQRTVTGEQHVTDNG